MDEIKKLREIIDKVDAQILDLIQKRLDAVVKIGKLKSENGMEIIDKAREQEVLQRLLNQANEKGIDDEVVKRIWRMLTEVSYEIEGEKMETVDVLGNYQVYIGSGILKNISEIIDLNNFSKVVIITDDKLPQEILGEFEKITVASGEQNKNIETVKSVWEQMLKLECDRKTLIINLGGGVIGDMGGFAASTYMRGVKFLQVPSTLLSAVDASVGGKVGVDFAGVKNLIGTFNQPIGVIIDVDLFETLPEKEFISGFGEIIKHGLIADADYFKEVTSKKPPEFSKEELSEIIKRSCEIKAKIISSDEKESGNRKLLNFGHIIGHALESISLESDRPLLHGEAISIGMVAEGKISEELGFISNEDLKIIEKVLENAGSPIRVPVKNLEEVLELISKDKKSESGKVNWTLLKAIGEAVINQQVNEVQIKTALQYIPQ